MLVLPEPLKCSIVKMFLLQLLLKKSNVLEFILGWLGSPPSTKILAPFFISLLIKVLAIKISYNIFHVLLISINNKSNGNGSFTHVSKTFPFVNSTISVNFLSFTFSTQIIHSYFLLYFHAPPSALRFRPRISPQYRQ